MFIACYLSKIYLQSESVNLIGPKHSNFYFKNIQFFIQKKKRVSSKGVIPIFLREIVLQPDSPTECIDNLTFRVDSPTKSILAVFSPTNR